MTRLAALDLLTRKFWRTTGRPIDLDGEHSWLRAPMSQGPTVGEEWLEDAAAAYGGSVSPESDTGGLLARMADLDGPDFAVSRLRPEIVDFYEHTAAWRMEVWVQWSALFQPGGDLVSRVFGRRIEQLALPMRPLDVAQGMTSRVVPILGDTGEQRAAGWIRRLRRTDEIVFSGCYSTRTLPGASRPSVHVTFPLESGNVQVFLQPRHRPDGGLDLVSPSGRWGDDGAYVVVHDRGRTFAARVPIHERFTLYVDDEGVLRTDHSLRLWRAEAVRLHYRLQRQSG